MSKVADGAKPGEETMVVKSMISPMEPMDPQQHPRQIKFVISDGGVDRDNDTIDVNGWDLESYRRNPVVLFGHDHSSLPVGKAVSIGVEGDKLVAVAEFATHPMAETVYQLYVGGFMRATSVGFRANKYVLNEDRRGVDFKQQELLEFSCVPVPANPRALVAASAKGIPMEPLRKWMSGLLVAWPDELKLSAKAKARVAKADLEPEPEPQPDPEPTPSDPALMARMDRLDITIQAMDARQVADWLRVEAGLKAIVEAIAPRKAEEPPAPEVPIDPTVEPPPAKPEGIPEAETLPINDPTPEEAAAEQVLELSDDEEFEFDENEWRAALAEVVPQSVREMVREMAQRSINQVRGRLD